MPCFTPKEVLGVVETRKVISAITSKMPIQKARTDLTPHPASIVTEFPISFREFGPSFNLKSVYLISGKLEPKFFDKQSPKFWEDLALELSPFARVGFTARLNPTSLPFERLYTMLMAQMGKWYISIGGFAGAMPSSFSSPEALQRVFEIGQLPLIIKTDSRKYQFLHKDPAGEINAALSEYISDPVAISVPGLALANIVEKFHQFVKNREFKAKAESWFISRNVQGVEFPPVDVQKFLNAVNGLGFPRQKLEIKFRWTLRDYSDFEDMPRIASLLASQSFSGSADADLLEFGFGDGKTCRLVATCNKSGFFELFFNVAEDKDKADLERILSLKLKVASRRF